VLVSEVLSIQVRNCPDIEGFLLPGAGGLQLKISQYADDATSILKSERSFCCLLQIVYLFGLGSRAKLNTSKSKAMLPGRWRTKGDSPFGLKWVTKIRILFFTSNSCPSSDRPSSYYLKCIESFRFLFSSRKALPDDLSCESCTA